MGDSKSDYSHNADILRNDHSTSSSLTRMYDRSKAKQQRHEDEWKQNPVNLNDVVEKYAPNSKGEVAGIKFLYKGDENIVIADMASGSLRVQELATGRYVSYDGTTSTSDADTHYYIKKRSEM